MSISNNAGSISFPSTGTITTSDSASSFTPLSLFSAGANGFWLDLDPDTWFEDTSFTTPSTFGNPIGAWADKSGNALHALQSVAASRPTYGRMPFGGVRNRLTYTEDITNAVWARTASAAPSASTLTETGASSNHFAGQSVSVTSGSVYTLSASLVKGVLATAPDVVQLAFGSAGFGATAFANVNVLTGAVESVGASATCTSAADADIAGAWRFNLTATASSTTTAVNGIVGFCNNNPAAARLPSYAGAATSDVSIYKLQFERASVATSYQKVVQGYDVTEPGVVSIPCPWFDGVDDGLSQTASAASLTQNIGMFTVFTGLNFTKAITSAQTAWIASTGTSATAARVSILNPSASTLGARGRRLDADSVDGPTFAQFGFVNKVATGVFDYANTDAILRENGAVVATDTSFQTAGNTENTASLYVGLGGVTSSFFGGFISGAVGVAVDTLSSSQLLQTETYIGRQIGGTGL